MTLDYLSGHDEKTCYLFEPVGSQKRLQDDDNLLERGEPRTQLGRDVLLVIAQLLVEVGAVGAGLHGERKHALDEEVVVLLERGAVRGIERLGQLVGRLDVLAQRLRRELEPAAALLAAGGRAGGATA